jgi:DNA-binding response OmpR family regulator
MNILVIEDNKKIGQNIQTVLNLVGYEVDLALTGDQGLEFFYSNKYDLIILDLALPDIDGFDICQQIREEGSAIALLMLTARIDLESKVKGLDKGADDYLTKPFLMDELLARVRALLRRQGNIKQTEFEIGDKVKVDLTKKKVTIDGNDGSLSPIEFRIIEYLLHFKGETRNAQQIYESVWGSDDSEILFSDKLKVHIAHIRKKLGNNIIKTVTGFGYMIE